MEPLCLVDISQTQGFPDGSIFVTDYYKGKFGYENQDATCYELQTTIDDVFHVTPSEGLELGGLLATVLVAGFTFRAIARALNVGTKENDNE